jgi:hypothetical protein
MPIKALLLRLHRWTTLVFALPLLAVIASGLLLSFEPMAQHAPLATPLTREAVLGWLATHDAAGKATGLTVRAYEQTLGISGAGPAGEVEIDLTTGQPIVDDGGFAWSEAFRTARQLHERLLMDLGWLVTASTVAMLAIAALGIAMGLPRLRNTLGGWHNGVAWGTLPLLILSPLTGLAIVWGISFAPAASGPRPERLTIREAVERVAERHDLANLTSLRPRGGRMLARVYVDGSLQGFAVSKAGLVAAPTNWPRALHEGNWHWLWGSLANIVVSFALLGLWSTGLLIWLRRKLRPRQRQRAAVPAE